MQKNLRWLAVLPLLLLFAGPAWAEEGEVESAENPFEDRVVVVFFKGDFESAEYLSDCELRELGGRECLVGLATANGMDDESWFIGAKVIIPWDEVSRLILLTQEQYHEMLELGDTVISHREEDDQ